MSRLPKLSLGRVRPPMRRILALDAGSRRLKLLVAQSDFGRLSLLKQEIFDLQAEGLVSADEIKTHLQAALDHWGRPPLALVLPQHVSVSQVIDLPPTEQSEVEKLIADETVKLSGVSESRIVFDFVRTETPVHNRQHFWVTFCQEGDIRERITRLGLEQEDFCEVTTTANALIAAYRMAAPSSARAILVHLGAQSTVLVVVRAGQGAFATSFQMGGDFFTRALARQRQCPESAAEALKQTEDLLNGPRASAEFRSVVEGWAAEVKRQLQDWFRDNAARGASLSDFEFVASGGGFDQPGLKSFLRDQLGLDLRPWPKNPQPESVAPNPGFEPAFGAALQALGYSPQPVSLVPEDYRLAWRRRLLRQRIELASLVLVMVCTVMLAVGTWHKFSLIGRKEALLAKIQAAQTTADENDALTGDLVSEYESLRPIFAAQQNTVDVLSTLDLLQQSRSNRNFWFVLLSDQQSYFVLPRTGLSTNRPARTNLLGAAVEPPRAFVEPTRLPGSLLTNVAPAKPGLIAELCVPGEAEASRNALRELVNDLKKQPLFSKVDLLSEDLRRNLADPKVIVPDRHYVLALDFQHAEFQQPVPARKPASRAAPRRSRIATPPGAASETSASGLP